MSGELSHYTVAELRKRVQRARVQRAREAVLTLFREQAGSGWPARALEARRELLDAEASLGART